MQSTCPRSFVVALQLGLGVVLDHKYGHRDLVDMVNRLGFCSSYTETCMFRQSAAASQSVDVDLANLVGTFIQYQADNVDHSTKTLGGHGSVPVMGQMATFTPARKVTRTVTRVKVNMDDIKR